MPEITKQTIVLPRGKRSINVPHVTRTKFLISWDTSVLVFGFSCDFTVAGPLVHSDRNQTYADKQF